MGIQGKCKRLTLDMETAFDKYMLGIEISEKYQLVAICTN